MTWIPFFGNWDEVLVFSLLLIWACDAIWYFLQEVDPCEDLTDDDIRTAIQNATGPKSALFVPEVGLMQFFIYFFREFSLISMIDIFPYLWNP